MSSLMMGMNSRANSNLRCWTSEKKTREKYGFGTSVYFSKRYSRVDINYSDPVLAVR